MKTGTGAELLTRALQRAGIEHVFGLPGTQTVPLFEALRRSGLRLVVATSEMSAAMMANGHYRASGKPAALVTIPGPGFTWALTGLAEARLDSSALLHITCAPATAPGQAFQLQAIDQAAVASPLVKRVFAIDRANDAESVLLAAHTECVSGEPGPVLVQVARKVWDEQPEFVATAAASASDTPADIDRAAVTRVAGTLANARHSILLLGQGCHEAAESVTQLAERLNAIVVTTTSGRGAVAEDHHLSLGFALAGNRNETLNALIDASDCVLAIGCKFSHNGSRGFRLRISGEKLLHVDASGDVLGLNYPAHVTIRAEARAFLAALLESLDIPDTLPRGFDANDIALWRERCVAEKQHDLSEPRIHGVASGQPAAFFAALRAALPRESCLVTDSGRHQDLAQRHYRVLCPRGLVSPTNLQSMGFAIGAAIGAKLAAPARPVVALIGDGGLAMSGLELLTAVRERIDLTVIVFVDGAYAAIRDQQIINYGRASGTRLEGPDCEALAAAVGATHVRLRGVDARSTLRGALEIPGVKLVEVALGDSMPMHWIQARSYAKSLLGSGLKARLRYLLHRSRGTH